MDDAFKDEITEEERAIQMGEEPPEKPAEEAKPDEGTGTLEAEKPAQETEKPAVNADADKTKDDPEKLTEDEKKEIEKDGFKIETDKKGRTYVTDSEGTKIPETRFGKIYREGKEAKSLREENEELKTKQTLFKKLGPDQYYKMHPEEAPEGYQPKQAPAQSTAVLPIDDPRILEMKVNGGLYDGMTLNDVLDTNRDHGLKIYSKYVVTASEAISRQRDAQTKTQTEQENAVKSFGANRAKELFGLEDTSKMTPEQTTQITKIGQEVINWQVLNDKLHMDWEDAYRLMNHDKLIKAAEERGASKTFKELQKAGPGSINTGSGGGAKPSEWDEIARMDDQALGKHIDSLDDAKMQKFLKEAPASIRAKHPGICWK